MLVVENVVSANIGLVGLRKLKGCQKLRKCNFCANQRNFHVKLENIQTEHQKHERRMLRL